MTKKNDPRAVADVAMAEVLTLTEVVKQKREAMNAYIPSLLPEMRDKMDPYQNPPSVEMLRSLELNRELIEAQEALERAEHAAALALEAMDLASDDELALARDPALLLQRLAQSWEEETRLKARVQDLQRDRNEQIAKAHRADGEYAARRRAAGLPPPAAPLPPFVAVVPGAFSEMPYMTFLRQHIKSGNQAPSKASQIKSAKALERRIAADLEERAREEDARKKEAEAAERGRRQEEERQQAAAHAREREQAEERAAAHRRLDELSSAYSARRAGGAAQ